MMNSEADRKKATFFPRTLGNYITTFRDSLTLSMLGFEETDGNYS